MTCCPDTPSSNGVAERHIQTLSVDTRAHLALSGIPNRYWHYAMRHAAAVRNKLASRAVADEDGERSYELFFGREAPRLAACARVWRALHSSCHSFPKGGAVRRDAFEMESVLVDHHHRELRRARRCIDRCLLHRSRRATAGDRKGRGALRPCGGKKRPQGYKIRRPQGVFRCPLTKEESSLRRAIRGARVLSTMLRLMLRQTFRSARHSMMIAARQASRSCAIPCTGEIASRDRSRAQLVQQRSRQRRGRRKSGRSLSRMMTRTSPFTRSRGSRDDRSKFRRPTSRLWPHPRRRAGAKLSRSA